ncbi:acetoacetate--CoA ligase, partial [Candidatus Bathyarchaeota archaeon]
MADLVETGLRRKPLWIPSGERVKQANLTRFLAFVNKRYRLSLGSYPELYRWSVEKPTEFWSAMWDYGGIISSKEFEAVVDDLGKFPGAKWFSGAKLNFAENLLRFRDERIALISRSEGRERSSLTYSNLYRKVARVANGLRETGLRPDDRVGGYLPNIEEAAIAMLAATSIGAVWACCGAELGSGAVLDRLGQIKPKVLFAVDGYVYKGKKFDTSANVKDVADGLPSLEKIVTVPLLDSEPALGKLVNSVRFNEFGSASTSGEIRFEQLSSDHPVLVMFTSGTTGKPKCMVQGAAGVLVNQLKETQLHADLKKTDRITYITSP